MATPNQGLSAEAGAGADMVADPATTAPVTPSGAAVKLMPATSPKSSSPGIPGDNGSGANGAFDGKTNFAMDDQSQVLRKIKTLQDELVKVERDTRMRETFESIESRWDRDSELIGAEQEQRSWAFTQQMKAQSFVKDTTAFAVGREWARGSEDSFIWSILEREHYDKQLTELRAQWEAKKGRAQSNIDVPQNAMLLQAGPNQLFQLPTFLDPMSSEARFNDTPEAQGYDQQERQLRYQIHDVVRQKHYSFRQWQARPPMMPMPRGPDENSEDMWPKPAVSYAQWKLFKFCSPYTAFQGEEKRDLFAIDVLDGEPDLTATKMSYDSLMRTMRKDGSKIPAGIPKMAQGLVPERIRLNGPQFAETFAVLGVDRIPSFLFQLVLLQPFRLLVYHNQDIRDRYTALKEKLEVSGDQKDITHPSVTQAAGNHESARTDVEQKSNENSHAGTQSPQVGKMGEEPSLPAPDNSRLDGVGKPQQEPEDNPDENSEETPFVRANSKTALDYLDCLISFMDTTVLARRKYVQGPDCRKVHFRDLWYLFNPGDEVVRRDGKQAYRVIEVVNPTHRASSKNIFFDFDDDDTSRYFQLSCVFVDFDGKKIGPVSTNFCIKAFAGERSVDSLEVYPLRFHRHAAHHERNGNSTSSGSQTLRQQLIKRGKKFLQAASMKLENTFYDGPTTDGDEIESQVVVDFETALSSDDNLNEHLAPQLKSLLGDVDDGSSTSSVLGAPPICMGACCAGESPCDDSFVDEKRREEYIDSLIPKDYGKLPSVAIYPRDLADTTGENALTDDEFLLMSYRVFAFVLRTRKWAELDLTYMQDAAGDNVQANENNNASPSAFERLVLPEGHQNIVLSLISQHFRNKASGKRNVEYSDIVRGKGKGLILLLHGAPGVGKTSTAEGIAEMFRKPLFTITCGDLGSTAKDVEEALERNFSLANRWGCILLLDEADVFLTSRNQTDFERNGLVAVFLRVLEYYAGILFLTTNRVGVIDEAFRSRIHMSLYYPPLGFRETRAVFKLNLKLIQDRFVNDERKIKIDQEEIIDFALDYFRTNDNARWNGRQIRNACQTALALAEFKAQGGTYDRVLDPNADVHLAVENFMTVSKAYLEFTEYLRRLYGRDEEAIAKERGLRARETSRQPPPPPTRPAVFGSNSTQPASSYGHGQSYSHVPVNPVQTVSSQPYQPTPTVGQVHMNPSPGTQQPQLVSYHSNPTQAAQAGSYITGQSSAGLIPQRSQEFMGMHFQPAQGNINQPAQPWIPPASPPDSATVPQSPPAQAQQHYQAQAQAQQDPGTANMASQMATSQQFQAPQSMAAQQLTQQQQQQTPQTWYHHMNVQNMQPAPGQNLPGSSSQEGGR